LNHSIPFATVDAEELSGAHPAEVQSFGMSLLLTDCALTLWKWVIACWLNAVVKSLSSTFIVMSIVQGKWIGSSNHNTLLDPLNGEPFIKVAEVDESGTQVRAYQKPLIVSQCCLSVSILTFSFPLFYVVAICGQLIPVPETWSP
jgi:hypothetical protein